MARVNCMMLLSTPFAFSVETLFPIEWLYDILGTEEQVLEEQAVQIAPRTMSVTGLIVQHAWVCARAEVTCVLPITVRALSASQQLAYRKKHMVKWHLLKPGMTVIIRECLII